MKRRAGKSRKRFNLARRLMGLLTLCILVVATDVPRAGDEIYTYDALGRLVRVERADGTIIIYEYDPAGNITRRTETCPDLDSDGHCASSDCDDLDPAVYPGAAQICDGVNNDCRDPAWPALTENVDDDGDGLAECAGDCDDRIPTCTADCVTDTDADGIADCADTCIDADGDRFGLMGGAGHSCPPVDCDDSNAAVYPGGLQICDGLNNDCAQSQWPALVQFELDDRLDFGAQGATSVHAVDLDSDGDLDVLATAYNSDRIAWHENVGGGVFAYQPPISTTADGAMSVHAADLDGDDRIDVVSASYLDGKIAWYRNLGGGSFDPASVISAAAAGAVSVRTADLDGDSHVDVLAAALLDDSIIWYRNDGSPAPVWTPYVISAATPGARSVHAVDLDGDGNLDVLTAAAGDHTIAWHENRLDVPSADFGPRVLISANAQASYSVFAADLDGDGDPDVLSASTNDDKIAWYENRLNEPSADFGPQVVISSAADGARSVHAGDLDGDGDADVLSASRWDGKIAWHENRLNEPSGGFQSQAVIAIVGEPWQVLAADLDGDGEVDVLSASATDSLGEIAWFRNVGSLEQDADGDGALACEDCDDANPYCGTDCTDADGDGFCITHDCNDASAYCTSDCTDADGDGYCGVNDCDDANAFCGPDCTDADFDGICASHDCDDATPNCTLNCYDADGDGWCVGHDCDESNPGAWDNGGMEINDGLDNHCPGEPGHGLVDEIDGRCGFDNAADRDEFSCPAQPGATVYEAARTAAPDLATACDTVTLFDSRWSDPALPAAGSSFFYLIRALGPLVGSWGADSAGNQRTPDSGCTSRWIFVTSVTYTGNLGGLAGGDAKCQQLADAAGLGGTYRAWLSDGSASARDRLLHGGPYVRLDGVQVAANFADLTDGYLDAPIRIDETGSDVGTQGVWTGTTANGTAEARTCSNWTTDLAAFGIRGLSDMVNWYWTRLTSIGTSCDQVLRLYCIEQ